MEIFFFILLTAGILFLGVFWIFESIMLYASAKETKAIVVDRHENGRRYKISVEIEEHGKKLVFKSVDYLRIRLDDNLKIGDKIVVWYSKKFKLCACSRSNNLMYGLLILLIFAPFFVVLLILYNF